MASELDRWLVAAVRTTTPPYAAAVTAPRRDGGPGGQRRREVTVASIARLAGVSAPTVSRVLNGKSGVALDTRQRVEAVIREHGTARALRLHGHAERIPARGRVAAWTRCAAPGWHARRVHGHRRWLA